MLLSLVLAASLYSLPAPLHGDFDRDGLLDLASFVGTRDGGQEIVIQWGGQRRPDSVVVRLDPPGVLYPFLDTAIAGTFDTWCGKGGGSDDDPCPRTTVILEGGELLFGQEESALFVAIWTGDGFEVIQLSG
ncbi:MAG: hypothetical protein AB7O49_18275 [Sphingomonadales bacterium]